jgi:phospholipid/cholesterol/gamma-HCH transport system ATP-binding protein
MPRYPDHEPAHVDVQDIQLAFGRRRVFDGLSCRFPQGRISVVLGASGGGKSTLLRLIGCLVKPDRGDIWVGDEEITCMPEDQAKRFRRRIGMMFQGGALLDSLTVFDNVALPLREHTTLSEEEVAAEVHRQFTAVGLSDVDPLLPEQLSGGMTKRVALARALVDKPEILLCDEPFSGLDPVAVRLIENLLVNTSRRLGITMIISNHHIASTLRMAHQVVFLVDGSAVCGTPDDLRQSLDPRVALFLRADGPEPIDLVAESLAEPRRPEGRTG